MSKESRVLVDTRKMLGPAASWLAAVSQALGVLVGGSRPGVLPFSGVEGQDEPGMKHPGSLARSLRKCYQEQGCRAHSPAVRSRREAGLARGHETLCSRRRPSGVT